MDHTATTTLAPFVTVEPVLHGPVSVEQLRHQPTVSVGQAAELLGVSRAYGYQLADSGQLDVIRLGGRIRVKSAALLKMLGEDRH